ncbi:MAG: ligand-binding sensor domain-containing protein, partial [Bacteroidia bacterium]
MFKKTYLLIFASLFLTAKITIATSHDLNVQLLDIEKGLSHNTVYDLAQDHFGYMWIATQNGLNRYDGYTMTLIAENQQNELSKGFKGKCITAVFIDSRNNLWVGTRMGHINVKNSGQFNFSPLVDSALQKLLFSHEISRFYEDSEGNIWIATVGQGVLKYEFRTGNYSHYTNKKSNLSSNEAFDIIEINEQILVACGGGNLNLFSKKSELFVQTHEMRANSPNLSGYRKRLINANGYLWLGTEGTGLYRINKENFEFINYNLQPEKYGFYANVIRDILPVNDSTLLIASDGDGLYYLNTNTNEIRHIEKNDFGNRLLNSSSLTKIVFDKQQNIWIGSYNGGVNIIKNSAKVFQISSLIEDLNNLSEKSILSVAEFDDNKLLLGTDGAGLCLYDKNSGIIERIAECQNEKKHPPVIKDILQVADNEYLLACFSEGIYLYNAKTFCFEQLHSGINAWSINKGPKGNYWFGTLGNGIVKLDESYNWINQNIFPSAISVNIMDLAFDQSQNLLVGTGNEGLFKYNFKTKSLTNLSNKHATIGNEIRAISLLKNGHLLIGTEGSGVSIILNNDSVYSIDQEKGLLSNNAIGFYPHEKNSVWISSFRGVSKLTLSDYSIKNYSLNGVENSNQFNHNAILVNSSKLYMGGIYGLTIMNLKADLQPLDTFKTFISNINIQGLAYQSLYNITNATETTEEIQLSYNQNSFEFSFASAGLLESANRIYTYQLKGFNKRARQTAPGQNQVYYTNINPG